MIEAYGDALARLRDKLSDDCLVVLERLKSAEIPLPDGFERKDVRLYGDTAVEFIERTGSGARF